MVVEKTFQETVWTTGETTGIATTSPNGTLHEKGDSVFGMEYEDFSTFFTGYHV
jgi:hypothetical protein